MRRQLLFLIFTSSALLWVVNALAEKYNLYFVTSWTDIVSHTLAGVVVGGTFIYFYQLLKSNLPRKSDFIFFVFFVGVMWEFFELYHGLMFTSDAGYYIDTAKDIFFDCLGGYLAYLFISKRIYDRR